MNVRGMKIAVGLSGGVDSAVTAYELMRQGAQVTGVFIKGWYPEGLPCTWAADRRDAMRVAAHLGIPFHTLDASVEYKHSVIDYLTSEYAAGRTPNPDIFCNRDIKFGVFYAFAKAHGFSHIATGHYARITHTGGITHLYRGIDPAKDQSYFLSLVPKTALADTLFPLGEFNKTEVRARARAARLPVSEKRDSQGICFLGPVSVRDFLIDMFPQQEGNAVDSEGNLVGIHDGSLLYTVGERVTLREALPGPWYVVGKNMNENILIVAREQAALPHACTGITLEKVNALSTCKVGAEIEAQYRYHGPVVRSTLDATSTQVSFTTPINEPIAPGQALALYVGNELVGGGMIATCVFG